MIAAYMRAQDQIGIDTQQAQINGYCEKHNIKVDVSYIDIDQPACGRLELNNMMDNKDLTAIIVARFNRLFPRRTESRQAIKVELLRRRVKVISVLEGDYDDLRAKIFDNLFEEICKGGK